MPMFTILCFAVLDKIEKKNLFTIFIKTLTLLQHKFNYRPNTINTIKNESIKMEMLSGIE